MDMTTVLHEIEVRWRLAGAGDHYTHAALSSAERDIAALLAVIVEREDEIDELQSRLESVEHMLDKEEDCSIAAERELEIARYDLRRVEEERDALQRQLAAAEARLSSRGAAKAPPIDRERLRRLVVEAQGIDGFRAQTTLARKRKELAAAVPALLDAIDSLMGDAP